MNRSKIIRHIGRKNSTMMTEMNAPRPIRRPRLEMASTEVMKYRP